MKVYFNGIDGLDDAIAAMYFSKRTWSKDLDDEIRKVVRDNTFYRGGYIFTTRQGADSEFATWMDKLCKWGKRHITLLKFIDISVTVEGLHRAGQDDWDSHAKRFDNRIIRSSTRLADFESGEKSDYYKDKILTTDEVCEELGVDLPEEVTVDGEKYVRAVNGYILKKYKDNRDVKRGLYMESIPSSFIFKVNLAEWAHIYKERGAHSSANPEVKELAELIQTELEYANPWFTKEFILSIEN
jgi:hypothetical protein